MNNSRLTWKQAEIKLVSYSEHLHDNTFVAGIRSRNGLCDQSFVRRYWYDKTGGFQATDVTHFVSEPYVKMFSWLDIVMMNKTD
ncbi:hypothetical protein JTE88_05170 [Arcanobacterium phocisimile]|uniref:Uncharacterized protein n=1 Tax=Arcanobacterium phocisimile TaxID=1302235 RepID=A0ABX7IED8_9ACTO|nr:hypothetical protein [Arcanobacterium phocisimile]QRV01506.1 hypothetical protein JTE88_05170 [Arcanobacterium phocisimile]